MKKRALLLGMMLTLAVTSVGCGKKEADANITEPIYEESSEEAVVGDVVDNEPLWCFRFSSQGDSSYDGYHIWGSS